MTIQETSAIMDVLTISYPLYYGKSTDEDKFKACCLWAEMFSDDSVDVVAAAVKSFIATDTKGFPPAIGMIRDHVRRITCPAEKTEMEAWGEVKKALSRSTYHAEEEFGKLSPAVRQAVGAPSQLREWAAFDAERLDSVIGSNFQRSYRAAAEYRRESQVLPEGIKAFSQQMADVLISAAPSQPSMPEVKSPPPIPRAAREELAKVMRENRFVPDLPRPMTPEEFEQKRASILESMQKENALPLR